MVARRRKAASRSRSTASRGGKLLPTIKKEGVFKGPGTYAAKQTGLKPMAKIVPAFLMMVAIAAATPAARAFNCCQCFLTSCRRPTHQYCRNLRKHVKISVYAGTINGRSV